MRALIRSLSIVSVCLLAVTTSVAAQDGKANNRNGLWGGIGLGYGMLGVLSCPGSDCDTEGGFSGNARIGFTPSPSFRVAIGTNGWYKSIEGYGFSSGLLSVQGLYYPGANDFFILGGVGLATTDCSVCTMKTGAGAVIGGGYDIPLNESGSLALTPYANWIVSTIDNNPYILQLGLGLTFN
jgi:hypothetical protein